MFASKSHKALLIGGAAIGLLGGVWALTLSLGLVGDLGLRSGAVVLAVLGLLGGVVLAARPLLGGGLLLLGALLTLAYFDLRSSSVAPVVLMAVGGLLGLASIDREALAAKARIPWFFGFTTGQAYGLLALILLIVTCPIALYPVFLMRVLCMALFACAFNLMIGYVGLLSFGHAAFFGMGAYIAAWTMKFWHVDAAIAIILGGATGAVLGLCLGYLAIRRSGIYFAMITLALAQMVYFFCVEAPFTGGEDGIQQVPRGHLFGVIPLDNDITMYRLVAAVFLGGFLLIHRIIHSPFGQVLKAIRENEPRATSLGYRTDDYKLIAFVLSTMLAGVAGGTKALVFGIATLTDVNYPTSGEVVLMTLLGGLGTVFGPVMGAALVTTMENYLAQFGQWVTVTQGAIFVICVLAFRRGVVGEIGGKLRLAL